MTLHIYHDVHDNTGLRSITVFFSFFVHVAIDKELLWLSEVVKSITKLIRECKPHVYKWVWVLNTHTHTAQSDMHLDYASCYWRVLTSWWIEAFISRQWLITDFWPVKRTSRSVPAVLTPAKDIQCMYCMYAYFSSTWLEEMLANVCLLCLTFTFCSLKWKNLISFPGFVPFEYCQYLTQ